MRGVLLQVAAVVVVLAVVTPAALASGPAPLPRLTHWLNISGVNIHEYPTPRAYAATAFDAYDGVAVVIGGVTAEK